jgi:hypothetical protein
MLNNQQELHADVLLDSSCEGSCIDIDFVKNNKLDTTLLPRPLRVINTDRSPNVDGPISEIVTLELQIGNHTERINLGVVNLGKHNLFLGHNWLKLHNPSINWKSGDVIFDQCPSQCRTNIKIRNLESREDDIDIPIGNFKEDESLDLEDRD